jgi:hypothetical protein
MSDYCEQCSTAIFGEDFGDMAGLSTEDDTNKGLFPVVLCEGCGAIQVDHTGKCVSHDCIEKHNPKMTNND